jgi:hypothetical protein
MNDRPADDTMRARMQGMRCDIDQGLEDVSASARRMVDWKHYVKAYPWLCLGTAAVVGFLIVPKRSSASNGDLGPATEAASTGHPAVNSAPPAAVGLVEKLVATIVSIAVRETTDYLGRRAGRFLGTIGHSRTSHHDSKSAS